ncbi:MAG: cation:proton antiporter [Candidatus Pacebacteria bacterium]|nr:cation:proton antiporter [Candidatus Paceibacterota bacterium]
MDIFIEIGIILLVATVVSMIMKLLKQPLVVGYILSGILVGPYVFGVLHSTEQIELFSKIGITILLFIVGLSLRPDTIKETGKVSLITGIGQIIFTSVFGFLIMILLGFDKITALYGSVALTFSSTIIILKLLSDRGDLEKLYGKISIGFLLVQDLVATLLLVFIPFLGSLAVNGGNSGVMFIELFLKGVAISLLLYLISKYILPKLSNYLAKSQELLFLFSVTWGLVLAGLFYKIGFSIEIGALIAGVTLSASNYSFEISSRMKSLRDFFIVLFFILLGSQLALKEVGSSVLPATVLSLFVLIGNPTIVFLLMNLLGYRKRTSFMAGLTVAQISEFSMILVALGLSFGHISQSAVSLITLVGIITIAGSTYLVLYADQIYEKVKPLLSFLEIRKNNHENNIEKSEAYDMIIFGYGRVGYEFVRIAKKINATYLVVDYNPEVISNIHNKGINFKFGDAEDVDFLEEIQMTKAKKIVSTIPDFDVNMLLTRHYRDKNKDGIIITTSHFVADAKKLYESETTYVIMSHYLGAYHASEMLLKHHNQELDIFDKSKEIQLTQIEDHEKRGL